MTSGGWLLIAAAFTFGGYCLCCGCEGFLLGIASPPSEMNVTWTGNDPADPADADFVFVPQDQGPVDLPYSEAFSGASLPTAYMVEIWEDLMHDANDVDCVSAFYLEQAQNVKFYDHGVDTETIATTRILMGAIFREVSTGKAWVALHSSHQLGPETTTMDGHDAVEDAVGFYDAGTAPFSDLLGDTFSIVMPSNGETGYNLGSGGEVGGSFYNDGGTADAEFTA